MLVKKISNLLINYIHRSLPDKTEEDLEKIKYGIDIFLLNFYKIPVIWVIAYILGIFVPTVIATISFGCVRTFASGIHARKGWTCLLMTAFVLFLVVGLSYFFPLNTVYKSILFFSASFFYCFMLQQIQKKSL